MEISYLVRGLIIGFSIAAPVGQIGVLCIRRTLAEGRMFGLVSGLGAATADAIYGGIAAFGLTAVSGFLVSQQIWLRLVGGVFLCYLGVRTFKSGPSKNIASVGDSKLAGAYASTLLLTLTNPSTILSFVAIFAGAGLVGSQRDMSSAAMIIIGVFIGSAIWWFILSGGVSLIGTKVNVRGLVWINRASGIIITGLGLLALISLVSVLL